MKRFTETEKWRDPWFRRLKPDYKVFWEYIRDACDNAGVWVVDLDLFTYLSGVSVKEDEILTQFDGRVKDIGRGRWWLPKFVRFQFGDISEPTPSRVHQSVITLLKQHGIHRLWIDYTESSRKTMGYPSDSPKDKDKDKAQDKDSGEEGSGEKPRRRPSGLPATEDEAVTWADMEMVPADFARDVFFQCEGTGWKDGANRDITNFRSYVKSRWSRQRKVPPATGANGAGKPLSILDLKSAIQVKDEKAKALRARHFNEGNLGGTWTDKTACEQYRVLRGEIRELKDRIEKMV